MSQFPSTAEKKPLKPPPSPAAVLPSPPQQQSRDRTFILPQQQSRDRTFIPRQLPQSHHYPRHRHREHTSSGCCRCLLWSTLILIILIILVGAAIGIFFAIYHPKHPTFSVSSIRLSQFEVTPNDQLLSTLNLNISTRNPSASGLKYVYSNISISVSTSDNIWIGDGQIPAYDHAGGNTIVLSAIIKNDGKVLDAPTAASLRKKTSLDAVIEMEGKVGVKAGSLKIKKVTIRVSCGGVMLPIGGEKLPTTVTSTEETCKVDVKIFKWYV